MNWEEALETLISQTNHEKYRELCHESNPNFLIWRSRVVSKVASLSSEATDSPNSFVPQTRKPKSKKEIIVCRFNEDLDWLSQIPLDFEITIYNKGPKPITKIDRSFSLINLKNIGRESHSMLFHIISNYNTLAEWSYFIQGDALRHAPDLFSRLKISYDEFSTLTQTYSLNHPSKEIHKHDKVWFKDGIRFALGDARKQDNLNMKLDPYCNPAAWKLWSPFPEPETWLFGYAAHWVVDQKVIKRRSIEFWKWMFSESLKSQDKEDKWDLKNPLTPWKIESLWYYWFSDPKEFPNRKPPVADCGCGKQLKGLSDKEKRQILSRKKNVNY